MEEESRETDKKIGRLEAVLFIHGEPMPLKKIEKLLDVDSEGLKFLIAEFEKRLFDSSRGLALVSGGEKIQLVTKPEFHEILEHFVKSELSEDLTPASLETLSLIAYFGPISRSQIDYQRGVNSSFTLRSLMLRGLALRSADPKHAGFYVYEASFDLMRHLGITRKEDLPEYEKFKGLFASFEPHAPEDKG